MYEDIATELSYYEEFINSFTQEDEEIIIKLCIEYLFMEYYFHDARKDGNGGWEVWDDDMNDWIGTDLGATALASFYGDDPPEATREWMEDFENRFEEWDGQKVHPRGETIEMFMAISTTSPWQTPLDLINKINQEIIDKLIPLKNK